MRQRKRDIEAMKDLAEDQAKYAEGKLEIRERKVILEDDLEAYLAEGWDFKHALNNGSGKVIVEKKT